MKNIKTILSLALAAAFILLCVTACSGSKPEDASDAETSSEAVSEDAEVKTDYLVLVNKENKLPENWDETVVYEKYLNTLPDGIELNEDNDYLKTFEYQVEKKALEAFKALKEDCEKDGITILMDSTYRSIERQQEVWDEFVEKEGEDYAKKYVAPPGGSEHHTGLAIDICIIKDGKIINNNDDMIAEKDIFAKIHEKLAAHGFILRYPETKEDITGFGYEPWHFRYIDDPDLAKEIMDKGICFEEYKAENK